jgi:uncharacterized protein YktA (UPF0223 family)
VQLVCNRLFDRYNKIGPEEARHIFKLILQEESSIFGQYTNLLSNLQFSTFKAIAKAEAVEKPLSKDFIQTYNLGAASSVQDALNMLVDKEKV